MDFSTVLRKRKEELGESTQDFVFLLHALNRGYFYYIHKISHEIGLSNGQPPVLRYLYYNKDATQRELSDFLRIKPASLTDILQRMEKNELVKRKRGEKDQRTMRVSITEKGTEKFEEYVKREALLGDIFFREFSPEEKAVFLCSLEKMIKTVMMEIDCWEVEE